MNNLNEIQMFALVVQRMSFTGAAETIEISKVAVSRAIAALENRFGARLFERTTRRLRLTEAGQIYMEYVRRFEGG